MRVAAIRVGADLWRLLESEAGQVGVSVSQYVREAALARATAAATARGEDAFELLGLACAGIAPTPGSDAEKDAKAKSPSRKARARAREVRADARALKAQSEQAWRHSRQLHDLQPQTRSDA